MNSILFSQFCPVLGREHNSFDGVSRSHIFFSWMAYWNLLSLASLSLQKKPALVQFVFSLALAGRRCFLFGRLRPCRESLLSLIR